MGVVSSKGQQSLHRGLRALGRLSRHQAHLLSARAQVEMAERQCLGGDVDHFNGVTVRPRHLADVSDDSFKQLLEKSLDIWRGEGRRGVWLKIPTEQASLVPMAAQAGFDYHHAKPGYVVMTKWLPQEPNRLPSYANHYVGVAGFVVNDKDELLLVQEKYLQALKRRIWKLPGGVAEQGENLFETAVRETKEETGVDTEPVALLCFRHMHGYRWNCSDFYFTCLLRPLTTELQHDDQEIAACKWMDLQAYADDPETLTTNKLITQSYLECRKRGFAWQPTFHPHYYPGRPDLATYVPRPLPPPPSASCGDSGSGEEPTGGSHTPKSNM